MTGYSYYITSFNIGPPLSWNTDVCQFPLGLEDAFLVNSTHFIFNDDQNIGLLNLSSCSVIW